MMNDAEHYRAVMTGRRSKAAGEHWENVIEAACRHYHDTGQAEIAKTPEPMKPIKSLGGGKFIAYYEKWHSRTTKGRCTVEKQSYSRQSTQTVTDCSKA